MLQEVIKDLIEFIGVITPEHYVLPLSILSGATIGQHVRHSIEMYQCLHIGYEQGRVDYAKRKRDLLIETSPIYAKTCLEALFGNRPKADKILQLQHHEAFVSTSYLRELVYCDEHTIHHMALIRVGIHEMGGYQLKASFGVAPSTLQYRELCAQ